MFNRSLHGVLFGTVAGMSLLLPAAGDRRSASCRPQRDVPTSAPRAVAGARSATYGNVRVENWGARSHVNLKTGVGEFHGPGLVIRTLDTSLPTQFRLTADTITGQQVHEGKKSYYSARLIGHIQYTISRHTEEGVRTVTGTSGRATYEERTGQIHLIDGVQAQLTAPDMLASPATLRATEAIVPASQSADEEGAYVLSGSAETNEIALTFSEPSADRKAEPTSTHRAFAGPVHLYHFRSGELQLGRRARVVGEGSVVEFTDVSSETRGSLTANTLDVTFVRSSRPIAAQRPSRSRASLGHAAAEGEVHYRLLRPARSGQEQSVEGTAAAASYDAPSDEAEFTGNVNAVIVDPDTFLEPSNLDAERLLMRRLPIAVAAKSAHRLYHMEIAGIPGHTRLRFKVKPPPPPKPRPGSKQEPGDPAKAPSRFTAGVVEVTGFRTGVWDTGKALEVRGPEVTYVSSDSETHSLTRLISSRLNVDFAHDSVPSRAEASGNVRYFIQQPSELKDSQAVEGTAGRLIYRQTRADRSLELDGPYTIKMTSTEGTPSTYTGTPEDRIAFDFTSHTLDILSPDRGGTATLTVRAQSKDRADRPEKAPATKHP